MNDMNVVIEFIETIADGGAESLVRDYATLVSNNEFKVVVVTIYPPLKTSANYKILKQNGAEIISIFPDHRFNIVHRIWNKMTRNHYIQERLLKIIQELKAKTIHVHLPILKHLKPIASRINGVKLFYTCHSESSRLFNTNNRAEEFDAAMFLMKNNGLKLIALHDKMRMELNAMFSVDNTIVVHNGVDVDRLANVSDCRKDILHQLNIPDDAFVVGHIGRFSAPKNHMFLLDIFDALKDKQRNAFLLMVGSGPLKEQVEQKILELGIQNRCKILEHRTDIPELLKAMDVFLFPSVYEGDKMRMELNAMFSVDNTIVVHNGVDVDRLANVSDCRKDILHQLNIPDDAFVVGHIGRFSAPKNHMFLLDIFDALKDKQRNAFLLMVGSGPLKEQVEQKILELGIQNRCKILEHRTDIPELLKAMDVFLFPSVYEGLPVTLVEAQFANKRCVVSDTITSECFFSPDVVPLSLSNTPQQWADVVLDTNIKGVYQGDISKFDMRNVAEHLREIYRS